MTLRWPRSLIARILLAETVAMVVVALLLPALMIGVLHRTTVRYQGRSLTAQARDIATGVHRDRAGKWVADLDHGQASLYATGYDGRAFAVVNAQGDILVASRFAQTVPWSHAPRLTAVASFRSGRFVGVSLPVRLAGQPIWVIASQDENGPGAIVDDVSRSFLSHYLRLLLPILLLLPIVNSLAIRRLTVEVRKVSRNAADIGAHSLHERLDDGGIPAEIVPLVRATNRMIARLESGFRQQGEFVANVAHELRTPLATLRVRLDGVEDAGLRRTLDRQVERLSHVISQLRDLAALEQMPASDIDPCDLTALATDVTADMAPMILAEGHMIALIGGEHSVHVEGNRTLIELALSNLISNAVRHTPQGSMIDVVIGQDGSLGVADNGPGVTTRDCEHLVRRFWRADTERSDSAGIGLSIVQRIVDVHKGTLEIAASPAGGALFTMRFQTCANRPDTPLTSFGPVNAPR